VPLPFAQNGNSALPFRQLKKNVTARITTFNETFRRGGTSSAVEVPDHFSRQQYNNALRALTYAHAPKSGTARQAASGNFHNFDSVVG
jgi:hypothetical protein